MFRKGKRFALILCVCMLWLTGCKKTSPQEESQKKEQQGKETANINYPLENEFQALMWEGQTLASIYKNNKKNYEELYHKYKKDKNAFLSKTTVALINDGLTPRRRLSELAMLYNGLIPYREGGRCYYARYMENAQNIRKKRIILPNSDGEDGLDGTGYLIWLCRNAYGVSGEELHNPLSFYEQSEKLDIHALNVGDICLTNVGKDAKKEGFKVGIVIGLDNGMPIVSLCDNAYDELFEVGSSRLCYIQSLKNQYINLSSPVDFKYFFRPYFNKEEEQD